MVDLKTAMAATSSDEKANIVITAIKEAQAISKTSSRALTKDQFAEKIFPGIAKTGDAPPWAHELLNFLWNLFF